MSRRILGQLFALFIFLLIFLNVGCSGDDGPGAPGDSIQETFEVDEEASDIQHDSGVSISLPSGMFNADAQITVTTSETSVLDPEPLPDGVISISDAVRIQVDVADLQAHSDSVAVFKTFRISSPVEQDKFADKTLQTAYARVNVQIPGLDPLVFYGSVHPSEDDPGEYTVEIPELFYWSLAVISFGLLDIEIQYVVEETEYGDPRLFHVTGISESDIQMSEVTGAIDVPVGKGAVLLIHGWDYKTSQFNGIGAQSKVRDYWQDAIRYLSNQEEALDLYCLYYNEDQDITDTATRLQAKAGDWFDVVSHGKMVILAHSMGGLLTRSWVNDYDGDSYLEKAVFIDTPHHGSALGNFWTRGAYNTILIPASGAQNLVFDPLIDVGGIEIQGNSFIHDLNANEAHWDKYYLVAGDHTIAGIVPLTALLFFWAHGGPLGPTELTLESDEIVEFGSQYPSDLFNDVEVFEHGYWHVPAKGEPEVLSYCLDKIRDNLNFVEEPGQTGVIAIDQEPDVLADAGWTVNGPQISSGFGDAVLTDMPVGQYTISWDPVAGFSAPSGDLQTLTVDETITFSGTYSEDPGPGQGFVLIPPASVSMPTTFIMGSEVGGDEAPHQVTLTGRFYMAATEVSNAQYVVALQWAYDQDHVTATSSSVRDVLDNSTTELLDLDDIDCQISYSNGVFSTLYPARPVVEVSWYGAVAYCDWLSMQAGLPRAYDHSTWNLNSGDPYNATGYRLPTEAEWEFACRAGTTTHFNTGDCIDAGTEANYQGNYPYYGCPSGPHLGHTSDVGSYLANNWGLLGIHGNVYEWCNDWYGTYSGDETDPEGVGSGSSRVLRGGGWNIIAYYCRSAVRHHYHPNDSHISRGFRPVRSIP